MIIVIDGVFFQLYRTGIARVWRSLLQEWAEDSFSKYIVVLDRAGTAPKIPGIKYRTVSPYDYDTTNADREMLQQVCEELEADLFISTYYTTPLSTPSVFIAYDRTPEVFETNLDEPMWRQKHYGIRQASAYITISHNTASDLLKFFPDIAPELVTVAHCGVSKNFSPASPEEIESFKIKYNLSKPYFIMVGAAGGHKNAPLFLQAFAQLPNQPEFDIVCTAHSALTKDEFEPYTSGSAVHKLPLSDEELKAAFSGAVALVYPSLYEGFGLPILEAMACGCPVITCPNASIPEVAGQAALYVQDDDVDEMAIALVNIQKPEVRESLIAAGIEQAKKFSWSRMAKTVSSVFIKVFEEKESMLIRQENSKNLLPERDYISPDFAIVLPDECFPNMIVGDTEIQPWPYLRREVPHNWYVDKRHPTVGFLSRDEAHILYNTALKFKGKKALEIGCWLGWSACHLALAGVKLEIVDPLLARPDFYESVSNSLQAAGVLDSIHLVAGYSPQAVEELAAQLQTKWSLIFIDGNHEAPGPLNDAIICEQLAAQDALILFHDLAAPDVAQGLDYFKQKGWQTMVYQTMQIMGVAWRGNVEPVIHLPDPKVNWVLPAHLQSFTVSGISNNQCGEPFLNKLFHYVEGYQPVSQIRSSVDLSGERQKFAELIQKGKECFVKGEIETAIATFTQALEVNQSSLIAHNYLTSLYWQVGDVQQSLQHHIQAQFRNIAFDNTLTDEFQEILSVIRPYTLLSEARLFSLYSLARQICLDDIPGNFVECGSYKGGSAALLAVVIKRYSLRPRVVYAFDTFEGMPEPTEADKHNGIPANLTDEGAGLSKLHLLTT
jgi:glycosyltransferase involved in cell wall biosynthesis/predicted O-methyltransferase YrrM